MQGGRNLGGTLVSVSSMCDLKSPRVWASAYCSSFQCRVECDSSSSTMSLVGTQCCGSPLAFNGSVVSACCCSSTTIATTEFRWCWDACPAALLGVQCFVPRCTGAGIYARVSCLGFLLESSAGLRARLLPPVRLVKAPWGQSLVLLGLTSSQIVLRAGVCARHKPGFLVLGFTPELSCLGFSGACFHTWVSGWSW